MGHKRLPKGRKQRRRRKTRSTSALAPTLLLTIDDACEQTRLGRTKIYQLIADGQIEIVKVGRRTLVPFDSLVAWLSKLREAA